MDPCGAEAVHIDHSKLDILLYRVGLGVGTHTSEDGSERPASILWQCARSARNSSRFPPWSSRACAAVQRTACALALRVRRLPPHPALLERPGRIPQKQGAPRRIDFTGSCFSAGLEEPGAACRARARGPAGCTNYSTTVSSPAGEEGTSCCGAASSCTTPAGPLPTFRSWLGACGYGSVGY